MRASGYNYISIMIYTIRIKHFDNLNNSSFNLLEDQLIRNNFIVSNKGQILIFEKKTAKDKNPKGQIMQELFHALTKGKLYIDPAHNDILICKINYYKQLFLSIIIGLIVSFIFSIMLGNFLILTFKIGLPIVLFFIIFGVVNGTFEIRKIVNESLH